MNSMSRRSALGLMSTAVVSLPYAGASLREKAETNVRIGLSQYSLRQLFSSGELAVEDYPKFALDKFGISEIDVWEGGLPAKKQNDAQWLKEFKNRTIDAGSRIFLWMTSPVDCTQSDVTARASVVKQFHQPIDNAAALGCDYVRIFVRAPKLGRADAVAACVETLVPIADYAHDRDVMLVIEPASSEWTRDGSFLADLMTAMKHEHCRLMPDFGKLGGDIYAGNKAMLPWTEVVSAKSHDFDAEGNEEKFDYSRLVSDITSSGFKGIIAIEYEGSKLGPVDGVRATQKLLQRCLGQA